MFKKMPNCDDIFQWPDHKGDEKRPPLPALLKTRFCLLSSSSYYHHYRTSQNLVLIVVIIINIVIIIFKIITIALLKTRFCL